MNIFCLSSDPIEAAQFHCDKHMKMIVESFQMLGSSVIRHGAKPSDMPLTQKGTPLKGGYPHHPSTRWAGDSRCNFEWLSLLALALCQEYTLRYNKIHACEKGINNLINMSEFIPNLPQTDFAIAINPESNCRRVDGFDNLSAIEKYRLFYKMDKPFAKWEKGRRAPDWFFS